MNDRLRLILLISVMSLVYAASGGVAVVVLYETAVEEQRARMVDAVRVQARMIEAVARHVPQGDPAEVEVASKLASKVVAVEDEGLVAIGSGRAQAIYTPGHTPGCVCWFLPESPAVITGDVLFVGSCGGVGYAGSDVRAAFNSLQRRLGSLPGESRVYPGHDYGKSPTSSLEWEFANNPALMADTLESFCSYKKVPVPG